MAAVGGVRVLCSTALLAAACGRISFAPLGIDDAATTPADDATLDGFAPDASLVDAAVDALAACPTLPCGGTVNSAVCNGRCVMSCSELRTASAADTRCTSAGLRLASVENADDNACLLALGALPAGHWIGYTQQAGTLTLAGGWTWLDGQPNVYTNWFTGEPQDFDGAEDGTEQCVLMLDDGKWRDTACGDAHEVLCSTP